MLAPLSLAALGANAEEEREPLFLGVDDFPALDTFENVEAFQTRIDAYVKECRDEWISSSMASECGIEADLWDRELNTAYQALMGALNTDAKEKLKSSQRSWIASRDETLAFDKLALALHYDDGQRMWAPVMSLDYSGTLSKLTRARTLQLRRWRRLVANPVSEMM